MNYREKIRKAIECPQFGNETYGEWGALNLEQKKYIKRLLDELDRADNYIKSVYLENEQLKDLIDTILNFSLFKEECPLNFGFENNTNEDKSQSIFYEDQWCENNCNDNYKDCWLKYFKKLQELEQGSDSNVKN